MGYKRSGDTLLVLTGSGGKLFEACENADWSRGNTYGFGKVIVTESEFIVDFIDDNADILKTVRSSSRF